jgi:DNA invertase Pin-like site-specific DNA recombinase
VQCRIDHAIIEAQLRDLKAAGAEKVFLEQVSSVADRAQLDAALDFVREGDAFMVCKLDRLARSTQHLLAITERLKAKGVALRVLNLGLDTSTPTGALLLTMLGAMGQFQREMMLERRIEWLASLDRAAWVSPSWDLTILPVWSPGQFPRLPITAGRSDLVAIPSLVGTIG